MAGEADQVEQLADARRARRTTRQPVDVERLADQLADRHARD
jgi:hypothetical protein